jgi:small multidrug resistance family-3 protein
MEPQYFLTATDRVCTSTRREVPCKHGRSRLSKRVLKSIALFVLAALLEIGGAWFVWQGMREHRGWLWAGAGVIALSATGLSLHSNRTLTFGRVLAAYGGVFIAGSLVWGMVADGFRPDRWDVAGAVVSLIGVGLIMYGPR